MPKYEIKICLKPKGCLIYSNTWARVVLAATVITNFRSGFGDCVGLGGQGSEGLGRMENAPFCQLTTEAYCF